MGNMREQERMMEENSPTPTQDTCRAERACEANRKGTHAEQREPVKQTEKRLLIDSPM